MISICIPIYNFDVRPLVKNLQDQINLLQDYSIDIFLIDDASEVHFRKINNELAITTNYIQLEQNIGRSKIRNLFLQYVTNPYLLFLDCDGLIHENNLFVSNYIQAAKNNLDVICGTRVYPEKCLSKDVSLNWKYGKNVESPAILRNFMSNNFLIKKSVLEKISFNENLVNYGQEDTLFGIELVKQNIRIDIIKNPVLNGHLEKNECYLEKNISSIENLIKLINAGEITEKTGQSIKLYQMYLKINRLKLTKLYSSIYHQLKPIIKKNMMSSNPNLTLFSLFKLGEFIRIKKESTIK
ncbi:glycosyltransferase family 2 protein [Chishuiella changwenlii]|uniref:glycosyltransferase family 2 protein n=1 Tax=Chishuiella changwenlii TaxID=1434701 RepID=UPI002FDAF8E8